MLKLTKNQQRNGGIALIIIAALLILYFNVFLPQYKRNRLTDPETLAGVKKLIEEDPSFENRDLLIKAVETIPTCINKMSNKEVNWVYQYWFKYLKYNKPVPENLQTYVDGALGLCYVKEGVFNE